MYDQFATSIARDHAQTLIAQTAAATRARSARSARRSRRLRRSA
jgi:hypothetical protein